MCIALKHAKKMINTENISEMFIVFSPNTREAL